MIDLTALWPRRPASQPQAKRISGKRPPAGRKVASATAPASTPSPPKPPLARSPRRARALTVVSAGLVLALLLAAINAAILFSASTPQAAEARPAAAHQIVTDPAPGMPVLAGRTHNATLIVALRERAANAAGQRPLIFALLFMQALVMGGTTLYLWRKAGRVFNPAGTANRPTISQPAISRPTISQSEGGYARG